MGAESPHDFATHGIVPCRRVGNREHPQERFSVVHPESKGERIVADQLLPLARIVSPDDFQEKVVRYLLSRSDLEISGVASRRNMGIL